jgi:UDP-N-acetylmuramate--alanine ligase
VKPDLSLEVPRADALGRVHFIGIGGVGMAGSPGGCWPAASRERQRRQGVRDHRCAGGLGATVHIGHDAAHLRDADTVVVTSAARETNPELVEARRRGLLCSTARRRSPP